MSLLFRPAQSADVLELVDIEVRAFNRDTPQERASKESEIAHEMGNYVVLEENGAIVGCARVGKDWLYVGRSQILKGEVGHVAVKPERQGQGIGTKMMQHIVEHMRREGFHLSRLGGLMKFYSRFGYEPFLRRYVHIPVPRLEKELRGHRWRDLLDFSDPFLAYVRPYHPQRDYEAVHHLRYRFDAFRSGQYVMEPQPAAPTSGEPDPQGLCFVYDDGEIRGWLQGSLSLVHAGDPAPHYCVNALAYDKSAPHVVGALVKAMMQRAQNQAPTTLICRLPFEEALFNALQAAHIAFEVVEMRQAADGNMIRVINLPALLEAVTEELTERLSGLKPLPWEGIIKFRLPQEEAALSICSQGVQLCEEAACDYQIEATQADFVKWLLGIVGFMESPQATQMPVSLRFLLGCLFPRIPCASGPWG